MTDARREWISKRAYMIWEAAGRPDGHDGEHWEQAVREREEFERVALAGGETTPAKAGKPLIEISKKARAARPADAKAGKKAVVTAAAKTRTKTKAVEDKTA